MDTAWPDWTAMQFLFILPSSIVARRSLTNIHPRLNTCTMQNQLIHIAHKLIRGHSSSIIAMAGHAASDNQKQDHNLFTTLIHPPSISTFSNTYSLAIFNSIPPPLSGQMAVPEARSHRNYNGHHHHWINVCRFYWIRIQLNPLKETPICYSSTTTLHPLFDCWIFHRVAS